LEEAELLPEPERSSSELESSLDFWDDDEDENEEECEEAALSLRFLPSRGGAPGPMSIRMLLSSPSLAASSSGTALRSLTSALTGMTSSLSTFYLFRWLPEFCSAAALAFAPLFFPWVPFFFFPDGAL
jgi:hypothetical protein